jgi:hypothetical protein
MLIAMTASITLLIVGVEVEANVDYDCVARKRRRVKEREREREKASGTGGELIETGSDSAEPPSPVVVMRHMLLFRQQKEAEFVKKDEQGSS